MKSIRDRLEEGSDFAVASLFGAAASLRLTDLLESTSLGGRLPELLGRSVLLALEDQLSAALAIFELDGVARRVVVCPPDLSREYLPGLIREAEVDSILFDGQPQAEYVDLPLRIQAGLRLTAAGRVESVHRTEWVLLTSGTTGVPKMLAHSMDGLTGAIRKAQQARDVVWGTFYDIRRFGGLQVLLRALIGGRSLVLSGAGESVGEHLLRLGARSVTHLTGTPSHWRRALMSPNLEAIGPRYIRLSGEIADQAVLNTLRSVFPQAAIGHAFASTEAGVVFEVADCLEGFPASVVNAEGDVEVTIVNQSLRVRSARTSSGYVGSSDSVLKDEEGFVDTGDIVELRGDRYYFLGRRSGVINVGGQKVHPEEVEAMLNRHPAIRMSCVRSRANPITGSLVVADVVLESGEAGTGSLSRLRRDILSFCRDVLPRHKVPALLRFVSTLDVADTGKMRRQDA